MKYKKIWKLFESRQAFRVWIETEIVLLFVALDECVCVYVCVWVSAKRFLFIHPRLICFGSRARVPEPHCSVVASRDTSCSGRPCCCDVSRTVASRARCQSYHHLSCLLVNNILEFYKVLRIRLELFVPKTSFLKLLTVFYQNNWIDENIFRLKIL